MEDLSFEGTIDDDWEQMNVFDIIDQNEVRKNMILETMDVQGKQYLERKGFLCQVRFAASNCRRYVK